MVALYSAAWWVAAGRVHSQADRWIAAAQAHGAQVTPAQISVGGYPFAFAIALNDVSVASPEGFGFTAQSLKLLSRPWAIRRMKVAAVGGFGFTLPPGTVRPALTVAGETLRGDAVFGDEPIPLAVNLAADTISASRTAVAGDAGREMTAATVTMAGARATTPPATDTDVAYDLALRLLDVSAQAIEDNPLGGTIQEWAIHARLLGPPPATPDAAGLRAWRDAGGTIDLTDLLLRWGPLRLSASGTAALDAQMQPEGAFSVQLTGIDPAIDALAAAGWIKPGPAGFAKLGLGLASKPGPDGTPTVKSPLTIQNRRISLGPVKVGEVPELKLD
jgi:hypothetical protein